jgi:aminobenzoyl-glutamate utilization protein B
VDPNIVIRSKRLYDQPDAAIFQGAGARELWKDCQMTASSDTGDVSFIMPANLLTTACFPLGVSPHTWQATASGGSGIGEKGALYAAYVLSGTAYDLLNDPAELEKIKEEFNARDTGTYRPLVGEE